jgi:hypothetical protein
MSAPIATIVELIDSSDKGMALGSRSCCRGGNENNIRNYRA